MRLSTLCLVILLLYPVYVTAQGDTEPRWLIEAPTAGLLPRGSFGLDFRFYDGNGILGAIEIGFFERTMFGVSFGGQNVIGSGAVQWNPKLEFMAKYRIIEEGISLPALAVGFQSQGYGKFDRNLGRYTRKSKGVYFVFSKNFGSPFGQVGFHSGVNRSFEVGDGDNDFSGFIGFDSQIGKDVSFIGEYDLGLNDNGFTTLGSGRGLLNAGIRWTVSAQFAIEFDIKNIFRDGQRNPRPDREIRLVYYEQF